MGACGWVVAKAVDYSDAGLNRSPRTTGHRYRVTSCQGDVTIITPQPRPKARATDAHSAHLKKGQFNGRTGPRRSPMAHRKAASFK